MIKVCSCDKVGHEVWCEAYEHNQAMVWITNSSNPEKEKEDFPGCVIGRPKETKERSEKQMQEMGLVGVYVTERYAAICCINQMMIRKFYVS